MYVYVKLWPEYSRIPLSMQVHQSPTEGTYIDEFLRIAEKRTWQIANVRSLTQVEPRKINDKLCMWVVPKDEL